MYFIDNENYMFKPYKDCCIATTYKSWVVFGGVRVARNSREELQFSALIVDVLEEFCKRSQHVFVKKCIAQKSRQVFYLMGVLLKTISI